MTKANAKINFTNSSGLNYPMDMRGYITSREKCPQCGSKFEDDPRRGGLFCPVHRKISSSTFVVRYGELYKRFDSYAMAARFLNGLRFKTDEGSLDLRDYKKDNPLGFETLAKKWLEQKESQVKAGSIKNLKGYINKAITAWGQTNVKSLGYGHFEDFLFDQKVVKNAKTRANMKSALHSFFVWVNKREQIPIPQMPECKFELGWRNIIDMETQQSIIDEVYRITQNVNPKVWMGIKWLSVYVSIRPGELLDLKEKDINVSGCFVIPHPKEKMPKIIPMLPEDIDLYESLPKSFPDLFFFRHAGNIQGCKPGQKFGEKYLYKWWKKACENLGIQNVDLYGGTRHSTVTALGEHFTKSELRDSGTMHSTNKAFERYMQKTNSSSLKVYSLAAQMKKPASEVIPISASQKTKTPKK